MAKYRCVICEHQGKPKTGFGLSSLVEVLLWLGTFGIIAFALYTMTSMSGALMGGGIASVIAEGRIVSYSLFAGLYLIVAFIYSRLRGMEPRRACAECGAPFLIPLKKVKAPPPEKEPEAPNSGA